MASHLEEIFPNLAATDYTITSPASDQYNCIAWAAGDKTRWWWPDPLGIYFWPENASRTESPASFIEAFRGFQYEPCGMDDSFEAEFEKVALFIDASGNITHMTRQVNSGVWSSKLGGLEDIEHALKAINGEIYGFPLMVMKRPRRS